MNNQLTLVVKNLLILNVLVFLACQAFPNLNQWLTGYYYLSENFRPWQIVTHMFMHSNLAHLAGNMFGLYMFGSSLESLWGPKRFLTYYMLCGLGAFFLHELVIHIEVQQLIHHITPEDLRQIIHDGYDHLMKREYYTDPDLDHLNLNINAGVVGASGAVFGILLAFGMLFPNRMLFLLFPPMPIKAKWLVIGYGGMELYLAIQNAPGDSVAHYAHLGGMLVGYIMLKIWQRRKDTFY